MAFVSLRKLKAPNMKNTLTLFIGLCLGLYATAQITGDTSVCKGETSTYYVPYISGAGYYWNVTGGTLLGSPTADSVVIQWSNTGTAVIVLTQTNPSAAYTLNVTIHPLPNPAITHAAYPTCPGDTGTTQGGSGQPDPRPHCEKVCKLATVTYTTPLHAGSTYQWIVTGAQTATPNNDSVTVTWDTTSIGSVLVIETNQWGCVDSDYICIEKVNLPVAAFTHQLSACKFSTVPFTNNSSGANSYQWYFGDGGSSTQVNPTHSYANAGTYTITLIAFNSCFCSDTVTGTIGIDSLPGPNITCPATVCAFDTATYSTTPNVGCTYNWIAIGGTITGGQGTPNVTVAWGAGQLGTLGLTITGCGGVCSDTTLIQIPIVPAIATIMGDTVVCPGDCKTYTLPLFSGAGYTWKLSSSCGGVLSDSVCCNEVEICWPATAFGCNDTLTVQYYDSFLHCGGSGMLLIRVRPELGIFGPATACANSSTSLFASPSINCVWTVTPAGPVAVPPVGPSTTINWNNFSGNYTVTAVPVNPLQTCSPFALTNIAVSPKPGAPVITGDTVVCAGSAVSYCATPPTSNVVNWLVTGGTPTTFMGSCVTVTWNNTGPYSISAFNQMPGGPMCSSDTTTQTIQALNTLPIPNIIAAPNACANGTSVCSSTTPYPAGATYNWSVALPNAGSVTGGQGTQTATFEWGNNAPQNVTVTLSVSVCNQTVSNSAVIALNPAPIVTAAQIGSLCAGGTAQVQATGASTYQWSGPGGFSSILNPATITAAGLYQVTATAANGCTALSQVNVQYVSGPTASISTLSNLTYCVGQTYSVNICALGNANYTYAWNVGGPTTQCRNFTAPGAYSVVVTDITNNCTALSNVLVVVEDSCNGSGSGGCQPNGSVSFTHTSCNPISFTNTSVNAFGFSWNFGDFTGSNLTNPTHSYNQAGFYVVTLSALVPSTNGTDTCTVTDTAQIEIPLKAKFDVDLGCWNDPVCFTDKSTFTAGNNITNWNWNFGDATFSTLQSPCHTYSTPGTYYVSLTVSNGLCTDVYTDTIVVPAKPTANFGYTLNTCINTPVQFTDSSYTAINYWNWNFGDAGTSLNQNPQHTYTLAGLYTVTLIVHDTSGCYDTVQKNVVVSSPTISGSITAYPDTIVCAGTQVLLVAPFCATCPYLWSTGSTNDSITVTATGVYSVTITDAGGCAYSTFITIIVNTGPPAIITNSGKSELCFGEFTTLSVPYNVNWLYQWISNDANVNGSTANAVSVNPVAPGSYNYTVIITDTTTGCADTSLPYNVVVHPLPVPPVITAIGATTVCSGDTITLVVTHPDSTVTFEWNNGEVNDTIRVTKNGCYYATAIDTNGCESSASFCVTVNPLPDLCTFYEGCYDTCAPYIIQGPAGSSWLWLMNGASTGVTTQNYTATVSGMYSVIVTNSFGCVDTTGVLDLMLHPCPEDSLCADLAIDSVACDSNGKYILYYHVINQSNTPVTQVNLEVLPPHLNVAFAPVINFVNVPAGGNSGPLTATIFNALPNDTLCFRAHIAAFDSMGMETVCCYSDTECVTLPPCPTDSNCCAFHYLYDSVWCKQTPTGLTYEFTIRISGCGTLTLQHGNNVNLPGGNTYVLNNNTIVINGTYLPANAADTLMCITYMMMGSNHQYCADTTICMRMRCKSSPPPGPCQLSFDNDICVGATATFNYGANPTGLTFNWQFINGSPSTAAGPGPHNITYNTPGCHQVICIITTPTNTIDCIDTICVHPAPQASIQANGGTLNAYPGGNSYQWYSQNPTWTLLSGQTNQFYNPTSSGLYCVVVTNAYGCADTSCIDFDYVGIDELTDNTWNILPNPNQGAFALKFYSAAGEVIELRVTNAIGEVVDARTFDAHSGENHYYIANQNFAPGIYFVQLKTERGNGVKRMVVR